MSVFSDIGNIPAEGTSNNRQYFEPGRYVVEIERVFLHEKRMGGGKLFIVEATVKESSNPNISPGDLRNWVQSLHNEYALPRIKAFIGAALGYCPQRQSRELNENVTTEVCEEAVGPRNPLNGRCLTIECIGKLTRAGKEFTHANWGVINGQK